MLRTLWKDFLEQRWLMKLVFVWGWLCVVIMVGALLSPYINSLMP